MVSLNETFEMCANANVSFLCYGQIQLISSKFKHVHSIDDVFDGLGLCNDMQTISKMRWYGDNINVSCLNLIVKLATRNFRLYRQLEFKFGSYIIYF